MKKLTVVALHLGYGGVENAIASFVNNMCSDYEIEIVSVYKLYDKPIYDIDSRVKITYLINSDLAIRMSQLKKLLKENKKAFIKELHYRYKLNIFKLLKDFIDSVKLLKDKKLKLIEYLKKVDTDIIVSTRIEHNPLVSEYAHAKVKIAWEHNHGDDAYINDVITSCKGMDKIVLVSKGLYELYKSKTDIETLYIPNVVDSAPKRSSLTSKNLISVGRLTRVKGHEDMIDIMEILHRKDKDIKLTIIGDGELNGYLKQKILDKRLDKTISLVGFKDKNYINKELSKSSIFLMTSYTESFGIVVIEAMSSGVPTVAFSSAEGVCELINGKNGVLIDNRDKEKMASEVYKLLNDKELLKSMGEEAYKTSLDYTKEKIHGYWIKALR